eukprot:jgi/Psemu1/30722/gm1.30722_g
MGYYPSPPRNASARYKVRALRCASTPAQVEHSMNAIADYVGTDIRAQKLDANLRIESRRDITGAGGLEAIVRGMEEHQDHLAVQVAGCRALANLSHEGGYENHREFFHASSGRRRLLIARCGGVDAVLRALAASYPFEKRPDRVRDAREHRNDLHEQAFRALWALSFHPRVKTIIVSRGGSRLMERLVEAASSIDRDDGDGDPRSNNARLWAGLALKALEPRNKYGVGCLGAWVAILALLSAVGLALCAEDRLSLPPSSTSTSRHVRNDTGAPARCVTANHSDADDWTRTLSMGLE